mmetsp:Transcript_13532/g.30784  ORF Transcript_13532/g.30784 Transcript_13532/m.30784 type:complete len:840 (+) Transcript_13532:149-2668(+)
MVELVGNGNKDGEIEVCGKDEYGVYDALEEFFLSSWGCVQLDAGDLRDDTPLPFCDALYKWDGFLSQEDGTNNMGLATMRLVDFMCGQLSWTLGVVNGGNVGKRGEIREVQVIFKAPHPMNMEAQHILVELRSAGYIEVSGSDRHAKDKLHEHFVSKMKAVPKQGHQDFSDRYYEVKSGVFKERGRSGENNLGKLTVQLCDAVVNILPGWTLVTMNGGNYGEGGSHREQQLVFRCDNHPLADSPHLMVEMREAGFIEVCGLNIEDIHTRLSEFLEKEWGCSKTRAMPGQEPFCDLKFKWQYKDMLEASAELTAFFHHLGWQMVVCSQGTVAVKGNEQSREQQILFRPFASSDGVMEPHFFIEMYQGEGTAQLYEQKDKTQTLGNQKIRVREAGDCDKAREQLAEFLMEYCGGGADEDSGGMDYFVDIFLSRGLVSNNVGCWTMRLCDFMVDRLGWSFVVCNICNLGPFGQYREQQLVFRWDGERREMPVVRLDNTDFEELPFVGLQFPPYWKNDEVLSLMKPAATISCTKQEVEAMQVLFDNTFQRILTRDRVYEYQKHETEEMPYRLEVVHMFRSEHSEMYRRFMERRASYKGGTPVKAKTLQPRQGKSLESNALNRRLQPGEALLFHGTNPSSAMGIMKKGFVLSHAGKATGTMFGYGIYLAECCSKSDEYARDDGGGTYPGLMAMLVCRTLIGNPYVVQESGDAVETAKSSGCDCVLGDRESKVGTYREFVLFDERQVFPEYTVIYKRVYDQREVPEEMRQAAKGTTGRNWQVRTEKGWEDIPPNVSTMLNKAEENEESEVVADINGVKYHFDLASKTRQGGDTGRVQKIRAPMRR